VLPELGRRGGGWVAVQAVLLAGVFLSALVGLGWPDELEIAAYAVSAALLASGASLLVAGAVQLGPALTPLPAPRQSGELVTHGLYRLVRHPLYGGGLLIALGWSGIFGSPLGLALTVLLELFFELKSRREEQWLVDHYPGYAEYRRRTPRRFVPFVY